MNLEQASEQIINKKQAEIKLQNLINDEITSKELSEEFFRLHPELKDYDSIKSKETIRDFGKVLIDIESDTITPEDAMEVIYKIYGFGPKIEKIDIIEKEKVVSEVKNLIQSAEVKKEGILKLTKKPHDIVEEDIRLLRILLLSVEADRISLEDALKSANTFYSSIETRDKDKWRG